MRGCISYSGQGGDFGCGCEIHGSYSFNGADNLLLGNYSRDDVHKDTGNFKRAYTMLFERTIIAIPITAVFMHLLF